MIERPHQDSSALMGGGDPDQWSRGSNQMCSEKKNSSGCEKDARHPNYCERERENVWVFSYVRCSVLGVFQLLKGFLLCSSSLLPSFCLLLLFHLHPLLLFNRFSSASLFLDLSPRAGHPHSICQSIFSGCFKLIAWLFFHL